VPYLAPEVIQKKPYKAEPIDIWSIGIVLVALLAGGMHLANTIYHKLVAGIRNVLFNIVH